MKRRLAVLLALIVLPTLLLSGCLVINVEKSESKEKKPETTQTEQSPTSQPAK